MPLNVSELEQTVYSHTLERPSSDIETLRVSHATTLAPLPSFIHLKPFGFELPQVADEPWHRHLHSANCSLCSDLVQ